MRVFFRLMFCSIVLLLVSCATTYRLPTPASSSVVVDSSTVKTPVIYYNKSFIYLKKNALAQVLLPVGKRLKVGAYYQDKSIYCVPYVRFLPFSRYEYQFEFNIKDRVCYFSVLRRLKGSQADYSIDDTVR